ncbi:MAG: transposase [Candidatus Methylomirabilales bacterium]
MARPLRIVFPQAYYHIMNRGLTAQAVFTERSDRALFLNLLAECHEMWGIRVIAYCLLDTHYHLLLQTPEANLSRVMRHLDGLYTQRYNRRHKRDGPLFRGRYKAIVIEAEAYLLAVARYIHQNPVAVRLVRVPEAYAWSSCRMYVKEEPPPSWLDVDQLLSRFPRKGRREAFLAFMRSKIEEPVKLFYESRRWMPVLGTKRFVGRMRKRVRKGQTDIREVPEVKAYIRPDLKTCLEVVTKAYECGEHDLLRSRRGQRNEARAMAMYVCRRMAGMKQEEIAQVFGVGGYSAVSSTVGRIQVKMARGGKVGRRYAQIRDFLQR